MIFMKQPSFVVVSSSAKTNVFGPRARKIAAGGWEDIADISSRCQNHETRYLCRVSLAHSYPLLFYIQHGAAPIATSPSLRATWGEAPGCRISNSIGEPSRIEKTRQNYSRQKLKEQSLNRASRREILSASFVAPADSGPEENWGNMLGLRGQRNFTRSDRRASASDLYETFWQNNTKRRL